MALGYGYGENGHTQVDGVGKDTQEINQRFRATLTIPINNRNSLSAVIGADFNRLGIAWQLRWGGGA